MDAAQARALNYVLITNNIMDFVDIEGLQINTWRQPGDIL
jgi:predicted nucleic acid-binding protein